MTRGSFDLSELKSVKHMCNRKFGTKFCMQLQAVKFKVLKLFHVKIYLVCQCQPASVLQHVEIEIESKIK